MSFRWVVGITLWTLLSGPIFSGPRPIPPAHGRTAAMSPVHRAAPAAARALVAPVPTPGEKN